MAKLVPHACNNSLTCPACIRRFYTWAENHTRGRHHFVGPADDPDRFADGPHSFYEAAAKFRDVDHRAKRS